MKHKILLVDDDETLTGLLGYALDNGGYHVDVANNGAEAVTLAGRTNPDLVILDVMMPGVDGWQACTQIRQKADVPILILSAKSTDNDVVHGLSLGADDYVKKPFSVAELLARVGALLRRQESGPNANAGWTQIVEGELAIDVAKHVATLNDRPLHLTPKEFELLLILMRERGHAVPQDKILLAVWGPDYRNEKQYLKLFIHTLKKKIEADPQHPQYIHTVRGIGYRLSYEPDAA